VEKEDTEEATLESEPFANVVKFSNGNNIKNPPEKGSQGMVHNPLCTLILELSQYGVDLGVISEHMGVSKRYIYIKKSV